MWGPSGSSTLGIRGRDANTRPMPRPFVTAGLLVVGVALVGFVLFVTVLVLRQDRLLFFPTRALASGPEAFGLRAEALSIRTEDGIASARLVDQGQRRTALLFFHGNAGNAADRLARARILNERFGLDVFLVDYRGYGRSEGSPSEEGLYRDGRAIYAGGDPQRIRRGPDHPVRRVARIGRRDPARRPNAGAPASDRRDALSLGSGHGARALPVRAVLSRPNRFDNASRIGSVAVPKLFDPGRARRGRAAEPGPQTLRPRPRQRRRSCVIAAAHHNDTYAVGGETYWKAWERFLASACPSRPAPG